MADDYVQSLLADGETIRSEAKQHAVALIRFALQPILVLIAAAVTFAIGEWLKPDGDGLFGDIVRWVDTLLGLVTAGLFILAIVWLPLQAFRWTKRRYLVTDRRVLYVEGVLRRNSADAGLSMITDVGFRQGFIGRKLGYGDLVVSTAASRPLEFRQIRGALDFKKTIMSAQQGTVEARAAEILIGRGIPAAQAAEAVATTPVATAAVAATPAPPPVPAWDGSDVPQMHEDDTPPIDPAVLGADGHVQEPAEAVAAATESAVADAAAPDAVAETAQETPVEAPVAETAEAATGAVDEAAKETPEAATGAVDEAAGTPEAPVGETAEAATGAADEETPVEATPVEETPTASHADALESIDSTVGGLTDDAKDAGADSVTAALASLADERDSGAITAEEFEARKRELLDRL